MRFPAKIMRGERPPFSLHASHFPHANGRRWSLLQRRELGHL